MHTSVVFRIGCSSIICNDSGWWAWMRAINKFFKIITNEKCFNLEFPWKVIGGGKFDGVLIGDMNEGERFIRFLGIWYGNLNVLNHDMVGKEKRVRDRPRKK